MSLNKVSNVQFGQQKVFTDSNVQKKDDDSQSQSGSSASIYSLHKVDSFSSISSNESKGSYVSFHPLDEGYKARFLSSVEDARRSVISFFKQTYKKYTQPVTVKKASPTAAEQALSSIMNKYKTISIGKRYTQYIFKICQKMCQPLK